MALKTFVKISGVTNLSDARYCAGMMVNMIGFDLDPDSKQFTAPEKFAEITEWLSGVELVGEFNQMDVDSIRETGEAYRLDAIQTSSVEVAPHLVKATTLPVIFKLDVSQMEDPAEMRPIIEKIGNAVAFTLIESEGEEKGEAWMKASLDVSEHFPVVLGIGVTASNVSDLTNSNLKGISLRGGEEIKPGLKDFDELADILEALEVDDLED
ncbi:phosphoribosylanthranilate isomerase [Roseivirga sp. BDSF3-8]|uniref:phosphoribosylanthranilate isomerase n=1 Tax=Roseivirga sp. BDSF3-8 TaxID=3241598 RepID=UPI003531B83A